MSLHDADRDIHLGTAGWGIPKEYSAAFPTAGTHLSRYAAELNAVEINTSFYRPHKPATYQRWAVSVPEQFRFAVKVPREATHERRLVGCEEVLHRFLAEVSALGSKLGPLLVQLPPSLSFRPSVANRFFVALRSQFDGHVVLEPRHRSWFTGEADALAVQARVARVAADPSVVPAAAEPGGWNGLAYFRLHGSPAMYHSAYSIAELDRLAEKLTAAARSAPVWCIFDNTAAGAAVADALSVLKGLRSDQSSMSALCVAEPLPNGSSLIAK